jgi:hypothetical protein
MTLAVQIAALAKAWRGDSLGEESVSLEPNPTTGGHTDPPLQKHDDINNSIWIQPNEDSDVRQILS